MKTFLQIKFLLLFTLIFPTYVNVFAQNQEIIHLWPGQVPGETEAKHPPVPTGDTSRHVIRITNITDPTLTVYPPDASKNNGASIIICPGGGYNYLAVNIEGDEVASWFNEHGYTAFVLRYRVPQKPELALMDLQRSIRLVRKNSSKWKLNPDKIGIIGFSAGGNLCAMASTRHNETLYKPVDEADKIRPNPNFSILIYPAYLNRGEKGGLSPNVPVDENTPPTFLFVTNDDNNASSSLVMAKALHDYKIEMELHLIDEGGHGYGLRKGNQAAETWPKLVNTWLQNILGE